MTNTIKPNFNSQNSGYLSRLGGVLSRMGNVVFLNGHPSESISGRCWRNRLENPKSRMWWRLCRGVDLIWFWENDHCKSAYEKDIDYSVERIERYTIFK